MVKNLTIGQLTKGSTPGKFASFLSQTTIFFRAIYMGFLQVFSSAYFLILHGVFQQVFGASFPYQKRVFQE